MQLSQIPKYDASQPYTLDQIEAVAQNYFKCNKFTETVFNPLHYQMDEESDSDSDDSSDESDSDSDYERKRRGQHKKKKKSKTKHSRVKTVREPVERPTQRYQGSEQDIFGMIKQLNRMSLQDPAYAHMYFEALSQDTTGLAQMYIQ